MVFQTFKAEFSTPVFGCLGVLGYSTQQLQCCDIRASKNFIRTWWFILLSKWVITVVISGLRLSLLIPFITRVITYLLSGMDHQVSLVKNRHVAE